MAGEKDRLIDYLVEIPNFLSSFVYAIFFTIASPVLIEISKTTGILAVDLGFIFTSFTIGAAIGQLTSVFYNRRFKKFQVIIAGYIMLIPLAVVIGFSKNLILFWVLYFFSGYIFGVIWIQANQYMLVSKVRNKERIITIFLTFYPIGAFVAPFISSLIISAGFSWRFIYYIIIFMISLNIILYIGILGRRKESNTVQNEARLPVKEIFMDKTKNLIFILVFLAVIFYCSSETIVATWTPTFLGLARNLSVQPASFALNLFWLFVIVGRLVALTVAGRVKSTIVMLVISTLAVISMLVFAFIYNKYLIYIFISIAGLGYSALFPLLISTGSTLYEKGRAMLATILFFASNIGLALAPLITKLSSRISMQLSISFSFILMAIVTIIILIVLFLSKRTAGSIINRETIKEEIPIY
jgi:MFS family permease